MKTVESVTLDRDYVVNAGCAVKIVTLEPHGLVDADGSLVIPIGGELFDFLVDELIN